MGFFLLLLLLLFTGSPQSKAIPATPKDGINVNKRIVEIAKSYIGVTEQGNNKGKEVERFQKTHGGAIGQSWCAYFIATLLDEAGAKEPTYRKGTAQGYINKKSIRASRVAKGYYKLGSGNYLAVWAKYKKNRNTGNGHIALVTNQIRADTIETIEGNTSSGDYGSQDNGDGVYSRKRKITLYGNLRIIYFTPII